MFDNRYLAQELCYHPFLRSYTGDNIIRLQPFVMTASQAYYKNGELLRRVTTPMGLFDLTGPYDLVVLDQAAQRAGITTGSVLRSDWRRESSIEYTLDGTFTLWGFDLRYQRDISEHWSWGINGALMHVRSQIVSVRADPMNYAIIGPGDEQELLQERDTLERALGLQPPFYQVTTPSDIDSYVRLGTTYEYTHRFHFVDLGARLGVIFPTAKARDINNPASFSLGGNKHWGMYGQLDADLILREDLRVGGFMRFTGRFSRTMCARLPVLTEPTIYGAAVDVVRSKPGTTFSFSPYITFEGLRQGLGFTLGYNLTVHGHDVTVLQDGTTFNSHYTYERSSWGAEQVTLMLVYDFGYDNEVREYAPVLMLTADIPVSTFIASLVPVTYGVAFSVELEF